MLIECITFSTQQQNIWVLRTRPKLVDYVDNLVYLEGLPIVLAVEPSLLAQIPADSQVLRDCLPIDLEQWKFTPWRG